MHLKLLNKREVFKMAKEKILEITESEVLIFSDVDEDLGTITINAYMDIHIDEVFKLGISRY
jgi:hypothetical protein